MSYVYEWNQQSHPPERDDETVVEFLRSADEQIAALTAELDEVRRVFRSQWDAQMRGVQRWRDEHPGNELVLPDHADLTEWFVEQLAERDRLKAQRNEYRYDLRFVWRWVDRLRGGKSHDDPEKNWRDYVGALVSYPRSPMETGNWFDDRSDPDADYRLEVRAALRTADEGETV